MSKALMGNLFLAGSLLLGAAAQVVIKGLLNQTGPLRIDRAILSEITKPRNAVTLAAIAMVTLAFVLWTMSISRLPLSYAYPIACSSSLLVAVLSSIILKEPLTGRTWAGTVLIILGAILLRRQGAL